MNTDFEEEANNLVYENETFQIVGCAMEVLNSLGHGLLEKPYENALCVEFRHRGIPFLQQARFEIRHRSVLVGEYIPDLTDWKSRERTNAQLFEDHESQSRAYPQLQASQIGLAKGHSLITKEDNHGWTQTKRDLT
jgi:GxxExxY protein